MRNPLHKRLPRELRGEFGKYLVIFLMMILSIGFVSGFLVADGSMLTAYQEGFEKYQVEDGHFRLADKLNKNQIQKLEAGGVTLYENFYLEKDLDNGSKMRIYADRTQVNLVCLMEGRLPEGEGELAIDRMYADNNQIVVGDTLQSGGESWKVTGLVALPDYSCLFENNNDMMFDSVKFGVGIVSWDTFQAQDADLIKYVYAWTYDQEPADESQEKEMAEDFMKLVHPTSSLEEFLPRYLNQAITFTGEDMGSDRTIGRSADGLTVTHRKLGISSVPLKGLGTGLQGLLHVLLRHINNLTVCAETMLLENVDQFLAGEDIFLYRIS